MYVLCKYMCVCVRENNNDGAEVHQHPTFIFIMYNYLAIPHGRGDLQDCLLTLNTMILCLITGKYDECEKATVRSKKRFFDMCLDRNRWHI